MQDKPEASDQHDVETAEFKAKLFDQYARKKPPKTSTKKIKMTELEALKKIQEHFLANPFTPDGQTDYKRLRAGISVALDAQIFPQILMQKTIRLFHAGELDPSRPTIPASLDARLELVCNHLRQNPFYPDGKTDFKRLSNTAKKVLHTQAIGSELMSKLIEKLKEGEFLPSGPAHSLSPEEKLERILRYFIENPFIPDRETDYAQLWHGAKAALAGCRVEKELVDILIIIFHSILKADRNATFLTKQDFSEAAAILLQKTDDNSDSQDLPEE